MLLRAWWIKMNTIKCVIRHDHRPRLEWKARDSVSYDWNLRVRTLFYVYYARQTERQTRSWQCIGWSDVTESIATIRSPFCGYNTIHCVELNGEDSACYSNKTESVSLNKMTTRSQTYRQSVCRAYARSQWQTFLGVFTYKMAAKINRHRYGTKLRQRHPMYSPLSGNDSPGSRPLRISLTALTIK